MTKKAFDKIAGGAREAIQIARGVRRPAQAFVPPELDVKAIRAGLHLSQEEFATTFAFTPHQIRQWEQGRARPLDAVRAYLMLIKDQPKKVIAMLRDAAARTA